MKIKFVILPLLLCVLLSLSACGNTVEGVGRDVHEWGDTLDSVF